MKNSKLFQEWLSLQLVLYTLPKYYVPYFFLHFMKNIMDVENMNPSEKKKKKKKRRQGGGGGVCIYVSKS